MSVIDPVADMLDPSAQRLHAGHRRVDMPVSKLKSRSHDLRDNHYVQDFKVLDDGQHGLLRLYLKYHNDGAVIASCIACRRPGSGATSRRARSPRIKNGPRHGDPEHAAGTHDRPRSAHRRVAAKCSPWCGRRRAMSRIGRKPVALPRAVTRNSTAAYQ